jgi:hypothetical protein
MLPKAALAGEIFRTCITPELGPTLKRGDILARDNAAVSAALPARSI